MMNIFQYLRNRNTTAGDARPQTLSYFLTAFRPAELWSGMAASAVVLPQAMAFGVALLIPLGFEPSAGAEGALLTELGAPPLPNDISVKLNDMDMCAEMTAGQVAALGQVVRTEKVKSGEIAFLQPGPRAADDIPMCPTELRVLDRPAFDLLVEADNSAAIALLLSLGKAQGNNLRWSAMEISRLAQW